MAGAYRDSSAISPLTGRGKEGKNRTLQSAAGDSVKVRPDLQLW